MHAIILFFIVLRDILLFLSATEDNRVLLPNRIVFVLICLYTREVRTFILYVFYCTLFLFIIVPRWTKVTVDILNDLWGGKLVRGEVSLIVSGRSNLNQGNNTLLLLIFLLLTYSVLRLADQEGVTHLMSLLRGV